METERGKKKEDYVIEFRFVVKQKYKVSKQDLHEFLKDENISRIEFFEPRLFMKHNNQSKLKTFREVFRNEKFTGIDDFILPDEELGYKFI